jgi:hypothetical protein
MARLLRQIVYWLRYRPMRKQYSKAIDTFPSLNGILHQVWLFRWFEKEVSDYRIV